MKPLRTTLLTASALLAAALWCNVLAESVPVPPKAEVVPKTMTEHGKTRVDNYFWLRERENPKVIAYLEAENAYTDAMMKHTAPLQEKLFEEIKGRIKQDDRSVPYRYDDYFYYTRQEEGKEYNIYCRKQGTLEAPEQTLIDVNVLAANHGFYEVSGIDPSPDHTVLAYGVDTVGRRGYTIYFKNLTTGELLPDVISDVTGNLVWAADNKTVFYSDRDTSTLRWDRIYRHTLGTDAKSDPLIYTEADETYYTWVEKSKSRQYVFIHSQQTLADEFRYLDASTPQGEFQIFLPRQTNHEYSVDHGDRFYIRTNLDAKNFRLMSCGLGETGQTSKWKEEIPHRPTVYLEGFELFRQHMVVVERVSGLLKFRVRNASGDDYYIDFGEPTYDVFRTDNYTYDTPLFRYTYTSMTTPRSVFDYDLGKQSATLLKVTEVLGGFDKNNYVTERLYAPARDGARVPISLVYRKDKFRKDGSNPLLLYGYGAYGISTDATFSAVRLSLIDRGFVYAIAHIRGGQEMGREWYEDGRQMKKMNTFYDFIDCGEYLIKEGYASSKGLFGYGGSAGGLLIGAVDNLRPDLWAGLVADVPYVDVINTMLDATIPLTANEWDEWGNPADPKFYDYMISYSPYDNVAAKDYPPMLVLTGLHDSQVQYWEPAKWVARLRATKTDHNRLLMKTEMEAGHGGVSGRYKQYREYAFMYAFLLDLMGKNE